MAEDDEVPTLRFTIAREGPNTGRVPPKSFSLKLGADTPIRIGRAPGNDVMVESRGVSQYHAELRLLSLEGDPTVRLCVRDLSMNGTGVKRPGGTAVHLEKRADTPLASGSVLLVPMMIKATQSSNDRAWLRVDFEGATEAVGGLEDHIPAPAGSRSNEEAPAQNGDHSDAGGDEDIEKSRMRFVELLLKTREVSAGTTYEQAKALLARESDWDAVDEATRKECFDIFVQHLGTHQNAKKKEKKKGKEKDKEKSKKHKHKEEAEEPPAKEAARAASPEAAKEKKKRDRKGAAASRSGSQDRKRKREKTRAKRSKSRGRSGSPAGSAPRDKRRRRARSGSN